LALSLVAFAYSRGHDSELGIALSCLTFVAAICLMIGGVPLKDHQGPDRADPRIEVQGIPFSPTPMQFLSAAALITKPEVFNLRINHDVTPADGYLVNSVARELVMPDLRDGLALQTFFVPLAYFTRGTLLDNMQVTCRDAQVRILPSSAASELTFKLLCFLTERWFNFPTGQPLVELRQLFARLGAVILSDSSEANDDDAVLAAPAEAIAELDQWKWHPPPGQGPVSQIGWSAIHELWIAACLTYTVFAEIQVRPGSSTAVTLSYESQLGDPSAHALASKRDILRAVFGVRPSVYRFALRYEQETPSYHLRFIGPSDQYVSEVHVERLGSTAPGHLIAMRSDNTSTVHYRHINVRPLRYVHPGGRLHVRFGMRERPPGMLGLVALVGLVQLVLEAVVLIYYDRIFMAHQVRAEVATLILGAPALVSGWMAQQISPGQLQRIPLTAIVGIAHNGFSSVVFTVLALLATIGVDPVTVTIGGLAIRHLLWLTFLGLGIWAITIVVGRWIQATSIFVRRLARPPVLLRFVK